MKPDKFQNLVDLHTDFFNTEEKDIFDKLLRFYQGKFWTSRTGENEARLLKTSVNITFAIMETGMSSLLPRNPKVTVIPTAAPDLIKKNDVERYLDRSFRVGKYRQEQLLMTFNGILYGRGILKTTWDKDSDYSISRSRSPRRVFFDLDAERVEDVGYWIDCITLPLSVFEARVKGGQYKLPRGIELDKVGDSVPGWMHDKDASRKKVLNFRQWVTVWEWWDVEEGVVRHMLDKCSTPLCEYPITYCPFDILNLNSNGEDLRGLSEMALIAPQQEELNNLLSYWLEIVRKSIPKVAYDGGDEGTEDINAMQAAGIGDAVPLPPKDGVAIGNRFAPWPMPNVPASALGLLDKVWGNIHFVSALADSQRGQVTGARTATELALIEGQIRNRLSFRMDKISEVTARAAEKHIFLASRYSKNPKLVPAPDGSFGSVNPLAFRDVSALFEVEAYSPMENNRGVLQEKLLQLMPFLTQNPRLDQDAVTEKVLEVMGIDLPVIPMPPEGMPPMPAPGAPPAPEMAEDPNAAATSIPPEMAAIVAQQAGGTGAA